MARGPLHYIIMYTYSLLILDREWGPQSVGEPNVATLWGYSKIFKHDNYDWSLGVPDVGVPIMRAICLVVGRRGRR